MELDPPPTDLELLIARIEWIALDALLRAMATVRQQSVETLPLWQWKRRRALRSALRCLRPAGQNWRMN